MCFPNIDEEIWNIHVNEEKHDIAKWFEQLSKDYAARMLSVREKSEIIKLVNAFKGETSTTESKPTGDSKVGDVKASGGRGEAKLSDDAKGAKDPDDSKASETNEETSTNKIVEEKQIENPKVLAKDKAPLTTSLPEKEKVVTSDNLSEKDGAPNKESSNAKG